MNIKQFFLYSLVAASSVGIISCTSSKDADTSVKTSAVDGRAVKGVIKNGLVEAFAINSAGKVGARAIATARTDNSTGRYKLNVGSYTGTLLLRITALSAAQGGPTIMVCDIRGANSCAPGVSFGQDWTLPDGYKLEAVIPNVVAGQNVSANITAITTAATEYARTLGFSQKTVATANSQLANLLNLTGDILLLDAIDITDENEVRGAKGEALQAALLSAAILQTGSTNNNQANAVTQFAQQLIKNNGQLPHNDQGIADQGITLLELLQAADDILDNELNNVDTGSLNSDFQTQISQASSQTAGDLTGIAPNQEIEEEAAALAKQFVADLRNFATATTLQDFKVNTDSFAQQIQTANFLTDANLNPVIMGLMYASDALAEAIKAEKGDTSNSVNSPFTATNGYVVTYSGDTFTVNTTNSAGVSIDLTAKATGTAQNQNNPTVSPNTPSLGQTTTTQTSTSRANISIDIEGTVENNVVGIEVNEGVVEAIGKVSNNDSTVSSSIIGNPVVSASSGGSLSSSGGSIPSTSGGTISSSGASVTPLSRTISTSQELDVQIDRVVFNMNARIFEKTSSAPKAFVGDVEFTLSGIDVYNTSSTSNNTDPNTGFILFQRQENAIQTFDKIEAAFSGTVTNSIDGEIGISLAFSIRNRGFVSIQSSNNAPMQNVGITSPSVALDGASVTPIVNLSPTAINNSSNSEDITNFSAAEATLAINAEIPGIADITRIKVSIDRTGLNTGEATISLAFNGRSFVIETNQADREIIITNQDSVVMQLREGLSGRVNGDISFAGVPVALVNQNRNGIILVRYVNGEFESLQ